MWAITGEHPNTKFSKSNRKERDNIKLKYQYDGVNFVKSNISAVELDGNDIIFYFRSGGRMILDFKTIKNLKVIEKENDN